MKMSEEKVDNNSTLIVDPSGLNNLEKVLSCLLWIFINVPGNLLLLGLIQYEKKGRHPLKKRLTDQVIHNYILVVITYIQPK